MRGTLFGVVAVALIVVACGGGGASPTPATATGSPVATGSPATSGSPADGPIVELADSDLGQILTDADGFTLYVFVPDGEAGGEPTCYEECSASWPPLEAVDPYTVGEGLEAEDFDLVERTDGTTQVRFYGQPLYYFADDAAPGETNGQALNDVWYVVGADGEMITTAST